jgi:hypothetical protein
MAGTPIRTGRSAATSRRSGSTPMADRWGQIVGAVEGAQRGDGAIRQDWRGDWWELRLVGDPLPGWRGQWSGWVEYPISRRRARKLARHGYDQRHPDHTGSCEWCDGYNARLIDIKSDE